MIWYCVVFLQYCFVDVVRSVDVVDAILVDPSGLDAITAFHTHSTGSFAGCSILTNSGPKVFCKEGVLKNFAKFTGKHLSQGLFFNKVAG